jgi:hypothetical protein
MFDNMSVTADRSPASATEPGFEENLRFEFFYRGNVHTHSTQSDGDSSPEDIIRWYRDHGYQFLALTDHNRITAPGQFADLETPMFKVVSGEEVTLSNIDGNPVHLNTLCARVQVGWRPPARTSAQITWVQNMLRPQPGTLLQIDHPNWGWAIHERHLCQLENGSLLEIANQHPSANNAGDWAHPSSEALWDAELSHGHRIYGTASDDMHTLHGGYTPPARGWLQVATTGLSAENICLSLSRGHFYFSTGVTLAAIAAEKGLLSLAIDTSVLPPESFVTDFIGYRGATLARLNGPRPTYQLAGFEKYVRARVTDLNGKQAWTQPLFLRTEEFEEGGYSGTTAEDDNADRQ